MKSAAPGRGRFPGLDLTQRGPAVQDALWSTSIQCGNLTKGIFEHALAGKYSKDYQLSKLSEKEIVTAVQDYKHDHTEKLFSSSPELWKSLRQRALDEKADLIRLADGKNLDPSPRGSSATLHRAGQEHSLHGGSHAPLYMACKTNWPVWVISTPRAAMATSASALAVPSKFSSMIITSNRMARPVR